MSSNQTKTIRIKEILIIIALPKSNWIAVDSFKVQQNLIRSLIIQSIHFELENRIYNLYWSLDINNYKAEYVESVYCLLLLDLNSY